MKHPFIVFGSIGTLLIVGAGVWIFFFLFYVPPPPTNTLTTNPFVEGEATGGFEKATEVSSSTETVQSAASLYPIKEITQRKVIGAVALTGGVYRFVEAGTGHVYEINDTGTETRLSNITFTQAKQALWSSSGTRVAIVRETENSTETFVGNLTKNDESSSILEGEVLSDSPTNVAFGGAGEVLFYTKKTSTGLSGISRNLKTNIERTLFTTPLQEVVVSWEPSVLIVTKATAAMPGYAYKSDMSRATESMPALTAHTDGELTLFSGRAGNSLVSWILRGKDTISLSKGVVPQKCAFRADTLLCAIPKNLDGTSYPDVWYRGQVAYDDAMWLFNAKDGSGNVIADLEEATRKSIDVSIIEPDETGFVFTDKTTSSLWHITLP